MRPGSTYTATKATNVRYENSEIDISTVQHSVSQLRLAQDTDENNTEIDNYNTQIPRDVTKSSELPMTGGA